MDRLFLTVYAKLLAAIAVAVLLALLLVAPETDRRVERNFVEAFTAPLTLSAQLLAAEHARGASIDDAAAKSAASFRTPLVVVRESELAFSPDDHARLARGEVVQIGHMPSPVLYVRIEGAGRALRLGPLTPTHPLGEGRSLKILAIVIAALVAGVYLVLRPVRLRLSALSRVAMALGGGDLTARAKVGPNDAIGQLSSSFNHMADEVERQIAAQRELLHMVSHELRTPLQRMRFNAEALRSSAGAAEQEKVLKRIDRDVEELDELLAELLTYVKLGNHVGVAAHEVDVRALLEDLCETLSDTKGEIDLVFRASENAGPVTAAVDARLLRRAVSNLVINALAYAEQRVEVSVAREGDAIRVDVDDDGDGIAESSRERIFQPFQRLDDERNEARKSFGLGLAIVRRVAELHGGSATALDSSLGGARLRLVLRSQAA